MIFNGHTVLKMTVDGLFANDPVFPAFNSQIAQEKPDNQAKPVDPGRHDPALYMS